MTDRTDPALRDLPAHDVDPRVADRVLRRGLNAFREEGRRSARPWIGTALRLWDAVEPVASAGVAAVYLGWMIWALAGVLR